MTFGGYLRLFRMFVAATLRWLQRGPVWLAELFGVAADLADPAMPESIFRPREWLWRLWQRRKRVGPPTSPGA